MEKVAAWVTDRVPPTWYVGPPSLLLDPDEIMVIGELTDPTLPDTASDEERDDARRRRIQSFRDATRERRLTIAREGERELGRKVSWGARCGGLEVLFSHLKAPATTRLGIRERKVLDAVVDAGLAPSRSDALAWCVRMVGERESDWQGGPQKPPSPDLALTGALSMGESLRELRSALTRLHDD